MLCTRLCCRVASTAHAWLPPACSAFAFISFVPATASFLHTLLLAAIVIVVSRRLLLCATSLRQ